MDSHRPDPSVEKSERVLTRAAASPREFDSQQLFAGARELLIRHAGECYTLRQTSKGKLILTK